MKPILPQGSRKKIPRVVESDLYLGLGRGDFLKNQKSTRRAVSVSQFAVRSSLDPVGEVSGIYVTSYFVNTGKRRNYIVGFPTRLVNLPFINSLS